MPEKSLPEVVRRKAQLAGKPTERIRELDDISKKLALNPGQKVYNLYDRLNITEDQEVEYIAAVVKQFRLEKLARDMNNRDSVPLLKEYRELTEEEKGYVDSIKKGIEEERQKSKGHEKSTKEFENPPKGEGEQQRSDYPEL